MGLYDGPRHGAFRMNPETPSGIGALLLHGFTGTPAEMRALGEALAAGGVAAIAPLLPGFGVAIGRLGKIRHEDWIAAALAAWDALEAEFARTVLIGFSMGGAVALNVAAQRTPDRLVLLAPFTKMADKRAALLPVLQHVKSRFYPFEDASFDDLTVRDGFTFIDPSLDLDDPATQARLRVETGIPTSALVELQRIGRAALDHAKAVTTETLIVQGNEDASVLPEFTRELVRALSGPVRLLEVEGDHQLVRDNRPSWPRVRDAVIQFATSQGDA